MSSLHLYQFQSLLLDPIDLTVEPGECVTLAGPSGCGKSLLLRAIADLDPHEGDAAVDDRRQSEIRAHEWRSRVGLLPAESHWWADLVRDHLPGSEPPHLQELGFGMDSLGWSIARLSSGEKQRLAMIRLLAGQPDALLLDEPTANLDQDTGRRVEALIDAYRREKDAAVIWVSHDPEQRRRVSDRAFLIQDRTLRAETWS